MDFYINKNILKSLLGPLIDVTKKHESVQKEVPFNAKTHADNLVIFEQ